MKKRILNKKGVTMAEVVVAMVIVALVTATATTLFLTSTRSTQTAVYRSQAQYFAEDALACFRASETADQFSDAIESRGGYLEFAITGSKYVYTLSGSRYKAVVLAEYPAGDRPSFSIQITDAEGKVIASVPTFTKGA